MTATTELLRLAQTGQSLALVGANLDTIKKKKKGVKDIAKLGVTNIVGASLIKKTGQLI